MLCLSYKDNLLVRFKLNFAAYCEILMTLSMVEKYNYRLLYCYLGGIYSSHCFEWLNVSRFSESVPIGYSQLF